MYTLELTEKNVVPMPGLVWHCRFTRWQCKKSTLKKQQLAENMSVTENRENDQEEKTVWINNNRSIPGFSYCRTESR